MSMTKSKAALRLKIKNLVKSIPVDVRQQQSTCIAKKILSSDFYRKSKRISIYLSTDYEVDTMEILKESFKHNKKVFVPTYNGNTMEMLKIDNIADYNNLPTTKWNIKQPNFDDKSRENAMMTDGLDLLLMPGVAFTRTGGRLGHGMGYYDKYLTRLFENFPGTGGNKTVLLALAFKEQIIDEIELPLEDHDHKVDQIVTCD